MDGGSGPVPHAVVTGAGGLGSLVAQRLSEEGWHVSTTGRGARPGTTDSAAIALDTCEPDSVTAAVQDIIRGGPVSAWVYCVGIPSSKRILAETDTSELTRLFWVNAVSLPLIWQRLRPHISSAGCHIVVVSSDTTVTLKPGNGAYSASKAALEAMAATLAAEHAGEHVRVTIVRPGRLSTPMRGQVRGSGPCLSSAEAADEIARLVPYPATANSAKMMNLSMWL